MSVFENAMILLEEWGVSDVLLPFILVFTVSFAVLQKAKIFGEERKYNAIVALVLGLAVVIPHSLNYYPPEYDVVNIMNSALPGVSLALIMVIMFILILSVFGAEPKWGEGAFGGVLVLISFVIIITIFGSAAGWWELTGIAYWLDDPDVQAGLLILAVIAIIFSYVLAPEGKSAGESLIKSINSFFGKK